ncbi:MAG: hypothetical protein ABI036_20195 [Fibrobacteria bacterium]
MRVLALLACLCGMANALYTGEIVTAFRVPNGKIVVDGKPERLWQALSLRYGGVPSTISFTDYAKVVLLQPENIRNADPSLYLNNPVHGKITMLAAYDNTALYFLFLVKTKTVVNAKTVCLTADNLWKADAPEVYLDPNTWVDDSTVYQSYFSTDASGLIFGSSPKTIQLDKPLYNGDSRFFFRNRATADKFQVVTAPTGVLAASARFAAADTSPMVVEMKIPYWGGMASANAGVKSTFISWGFNMYPDSLWGDCDGNPIAYRWAKNYLNYDQAASKPPGWRKNDSTHYDPSRSWDGWGRFDMSPMPEVDSSQCRSSTAWDLSSWAESCQSTTAGSISPRAKAAPVRTPARSIDADPVMGRDARGRAIPANRRPAFPVFQRP